MTVIAVLGGTSLGSIDGFDLVEKRSVMTPFGQPSSDLLLGRLAEKDVVFLARHGLDHSIAPHRINYRANIWALKEVGAEQIIASAAVGGIDAAMAPGVLAVPDQLIDYTSGREQSFFSDTFDVDKHIDFTYPYTESLRQKIINAVKLHGYDLVEQGVYAAVQGPRLETAAEISRLKNDGCTMVGMTAMPEAALARELELDYASCALVVNWAAGLTGDVISMAEIRDTLSTGQTKLNQVIASLIQQ